MEAKTDSVARSSLTSREIDCSPKVCKLTTFFRALVRFYEMATSRGVRNPTVTQSQMLKI